MSGARGTTLLSPNGASTSRSVDLWLRPQAQDFGAGGKVLLDLEDNRFLVPDVDTLPRRDRELLQRYIYW